MFTVPVTGVWRISFTLRSVVLTGQYNSVYMFHNDKRIVATQHDSTSETGKASFTGGRELITRAEQGDTFHLGTGRMDNEFWRIITCFEFVSL